MPDFIALRGDTSDRIPGAKGVGPATAASLLTRYGTLEAALNDGRFANQAENLRLYRRLATMDATAAVPKIPDQSPDWRGAAALAQDWGLRALSERFLGLAP